MRHLSLVLTAVIFMSLTGPVFAHPAQPNSQRAAYQQEDVVFRSLNLTDDTVDVYRNDNVALFGIETEAVSAERTISPGDYTVDIYEAGRPPGTNTPLLSDNLQLGTTAPITAVLLNVRLHHLFGEFLITGGASSLTKQDFDFKPNHAYTFVAVGNGLIDGTLQVLTMDWSWQSGSAPISP